MKFQQAFKSEVQRLVKAEIAKFAVAQSKELRSLKQELSRLHEKPAAVKRIPVGKSRKSGKSAVPAATPESNVKVSAAAIRQLRKRHKLSRRELSALLGCSAGAIVLWEGGKATPRDKYKAAIVQLRSLSKKQIDELLAQKGAKKARRGRPKKADVVAKPGVKTGARRGRRKKAARKGRKGTKK